MKILLTGANGYIGTRLLTLLGEEGHEIVALVRSKRRLDIPEHLQDQVTAIEADLCDRESLAKIPKEIDAAYYLVHSMGHKPSGFAQMEADCARNFVDALSATEAKQIIYLSGLSHQEELSEHMQSRHNVQDILCNGSIPVTVLRAGIIIGAGSASFEILRDLVEKLPMMVAPRWVYSRCQPISVVDVLYYLEKVLGNPDCQGQTFEIGGPDILTYREMLLRFAKIRGLKRFIITVPLLTPYLSSLWLFFITSTNFSLAQALVDSLTIDAVATDTRIQEILPHDCLGFEEAVQLSFKRIEQNAVISSWKDAVNQSRLQPELTAYMKVPEHGCVSNVHRMEANVSKEEVLERLWKIGGENGWYSMDWAWEIRGFLDQVVGGVGLRRGRTHPTRLRPGDALDFWRVILADKQQGHLLLYAEMRLPGEAWLEWTISGDESHTCITQKATFRPRGLFGRIYWYGLMPIHSLIFRRLCAQILGG